jgi:hypothetical protein
VIRTTQKDYRERRLPGEMRRLLNRKIRRQACGFALCHEEFTDYNDIMPHHRKQNVAGLEESGTIASMHRPLSSGISTFDQAALPVISLKACMQCSWISSTSF